MISERRRRTARAWAMGLGVLLSASAPAVAVNVIPMTSSATLLSGTTGQIVDMASENGSLYAVGYSSGGASGADIWVSRWSSNGLTLISSMTFNGTGNGDDAATGVTLDPATGDVYVVGSSSMSGLGTVKWLGKFDPSLNVISSTTYALPVSSNIFGGQEGVVLAPNGNLYIADSVLIGGVSEMGLSEFDASLNFISSATYFNGFDQNYAFRLAADNASNLYVAGGVSPSAGASNDLWIGKFSASLILTATTTVAGPGGNSDSALDLKIDPSDNYLFVGGYLNNSGATVDLWIGKYSLNLASLQAPRSLSGAGPGNSAANALIVTSTRVYVAGALSTGASATGVFLGELDYGLTVLSTAAFSSSGAATDHAYGLAFDTASASLFVGGEIDGAGPRTPWLGEFAAPPVPAGQVFAEAINLAPSTAPVLAGSLPLLRLGLWTQNGPAALNSLSVNLAGNAPASNFSYASLYEDAGAGGIPGSGDGVFEQGTDVLLSSAAFTPANPPVATLNAAAGPLYSDLSSTTHYFFLTVSYSSMSAGRQLGLTMPSPGFIGLSQGVMAPQPIYPMMTGLAVVQQGLAAFPPAQGAPVPTPNPAAAGGFDTGLTVQIGQPLLVTATGTWNSGGYGVTTATGVAATGGLDAALHLGSLVGRIGGGPWFQLGSSVTVTAAQGGDLFLTMNDTDYYDNSGQISVGAQVLASTVAKVWTGGSGVNFNASINANWLNGLPPLPGDSVTFDGAISTMPCIWDIGNSNIGLLTLKPSYTGVVFLGSSGAAGTAGASQITVSSDAVVQNGVLTLGGGAVLTVQGQLTVNGGSFFMGAGGGTLLLSKSGAVLDNGGTFASAGTAAPVWVKAINALDGFPFRALNGTVLLNDPLGTRFQDTTGFVVGSSASVVLNNLGFANAFPKSFPEIVFSTPNAISPVRFDFSALDFDANTSTNIDASALPAGSTVSVVNATGAHMGSPFDRDPNRVVVWSPDGGGSASISGTVNYPAPVAGPVVFGYARPSAGFSGPLRNSDPSKLAFGGIQTTTGSFTLAGLSAPNTYYLFAWMLKTSTSGAPQGYDPRGGYGHTALEGFVSDPIFVGPGAAATGITLNLEDWSVITGTVTNNSSQTGPVDVQAWIGAPAVPTSTMTAGVSFPSMSPGAAQTYSLSVPSGTVQSVGFVDVNGNGLADAFEAQAASGPTVAPALSTVPGGLLSLSGGTSAPGGVLTVTTATAHPGYVGVPGPGFTLPQALLKLRLAPSLLAVTLTSLRVDMSGAIPALAYQIALWRDDNPDGVFDNPTLGGAGPFDKQVGQTFVPGGVSTTTIQLSESIPAGTTSTYFVTLDLLGQGTTGPVGVTIVSTSSFGLSQGSLAAQPGLYPIASGPAAVLFASRAGQDAAAPSQGGQDTGVSLAAGQTVTIYANGTWAPDSGGTTSSAGRAGTLNENTIVPQAQLGQLVARVGYTAGNGTSWQPVVSGTPMTASASGDLFLAMNDFSGAYFDNYGALYSSFTVSGSTTGEIAGTISYLGTLGGGSNLVVRAGTTNASCPGCPNSPFNVVSTITLPMTGGTTSYPYVFAALPPNSAYVVDAYVDTTPTQSGNSGFPKGVAAGSTATAVDFTMALGTGTLNGTIAYSGVQNSGDFYLGVTTVSDLSQEVYFFGSYSSSTAGPFSIPNLPTPNTFYIVGYRDVNGDQQPDGAEPFGVVGVSTGAFADLPSLFTPVFLDTNATQGGLTLNLVDHGAISGNVSISTALQAGYDLVIDIGHGNPLSDSYQLEDEEYIFYDPSRTSGAPQPYVGSLLRPATDYSVFAFVDVNNDAIYDPAVDASGEIDGPIGVPQGGFTQADLTIGGGSVAPPPVSGFAGKAATSEVVWTWNLAPGATSYQLRSSTSGIVAALGAAASTYADVLAAGATSSIVSITAANAYGTGPAAASPVLAALPAMPGTPGSAAIFQSSAAINWGAGGNDPAVQYQLSRATAVTGPFFVSTTTAATLIADTGLSPGTTYTYEVQAFNVNGASSTLSTPVSVVTLPASGPSIGGFAAYAGGQGPRMVFQVFTNAASTGTAAAQELIPTGPSQPFFVALPPNTSYYARVFVDILGDQVLHAAADHGQFQYSTAPPAAIYVANSPVTISTIALTVDTTAPASPYGLSAASPGIGVVALTWQAPTTNADGTPLIDLAGYRVERATSPSAAFTTIGAPAAASFADVFASTATAAYYRVRAADLAGNLSAASGLISAQASAGGTISGGVVYAGTTVSGPFRVRLSTTPSGPFTAESTLNPFSFTGLLDGVYYVRAFRDVNGDGVQQDGEPGGTLGGLAQPYPVNIYGASANTGSTLNVCDRAPAAFGPPGSPQAYAVSISTAGCPALDQGTGFFTSPLSFRVGGGAPGSVGVGANVGIQMQSAFPNRLLLLGPDGGVAAQDSRSGGASISFNVNSPGLYLIEPTSFNPYDAGSATVTVSVNGGFSGSISGTIVYSGAQNGPVILQLFPNSATNSFPLVRISTPNPGNFTLQGLQDGTYYLRAFRDSNGNFSQDGGEAAGSFGVSATTLTAIQVQGGVALVGGAAGAQADVTLTDPAAGGITGLILRQGSQAGVIRVEVGQPQTNCGNCGPNVVAFATMSAAGAFSVPFVPAATNYIVTAYVDVNGNGQADPLEAKASTSPISAQPNQGTAVNLVVADPGSGAAGNAAIQGTVSYGGTSTGPLLMAFATDSQFQTIAYTLSQASTGSFYRSGVLSNTTYYVAAFLDTNNNGEPDDKMGEPLGFYGATPANDIGGAQPLYVASGVASANLTLGDAPSGAIIGQVSYIGSQFIGKSLVVQADSSSGGNGQKFVVPAVASGTVYNYVLPYLAAGSGWSVSAFVDVNGNGSQDFGEPSAFFGPATCTAGGPCIGQPVAVSSGTGAYPTYGVNVTVNDPGQGNITQNTGSIEIEGSYLGSQSGPIVARLFTNSTYTGTPFQTMTIPMPPGPGNFDGVLQGVPFGAYYLDAFRDPSASGIYNPTFDAYGTLQKATLSSDNNYAGGNGGSQVVDPGQGGSVNVYSGSFSAAGGARFDGGAVDIGASISADTITAGGPFLYVQGVTKQNSGIVSSLVKYSSAGVFMSSATLPTFDTAIGLPALDAVGDIYLSQDIASGGVSSGTIVKYSPSLVPLQTLIISSYTNARNLVYANGLIYASIDGNNSGGDVVRSYSTSLSQAGSGTYAFPAAAFGACPSCSRASAQTLAAAPNGDVYVVAKSQGGSFTGSPSFFSLLRFGPALGAPAAQEDITALVPNAKNSTQLSLGTDASGDVFLTLIPTGDNSARTYKFTPGLQQVASASFGPLLSHFGGGVANLAVSTDNYVYEAWEAAAHGGDFLALRYDDNLNLVSSRTFDGLDNAHEDFAFGLAVQDSSNVFLTGGAANGAGNLDWATIRLNMNASGAASGAGAAVVISTANAVNAVYGSLTYSGALVSSGTVRAVLLPLGSSTPIRLSSAPFAASVPYLFNNVPAGAYQIQAFDDLNGNLSPDAGEPVAISSSTGFQFSGTSSTLLNLSFCDRRPIAAGVPLTATITPADCPAVDRGGASQRLYTFAGTRGQAVTIEMDAINFSDTYLNLYDPNGNLAASDDDGAGNKNARIANFLLPSDGLYTIGASPYSAGLSSATFKLSLTGSAGSLGSLSGTVAYSGAQGGAVYVGLFSSSTFGTPLQGINIPGPGPFSFTNLTTGSTYYLGAFIDVNGNGRPDAGEDVGVFGSTATGAAPIYLRSGQNVSGVNFAIVPGFSGSTSSGTYAEITGAVAYAGAQTGPLHVQFFSDSSFQGRPVSERVLPVFGPYDVPLPPNVPYYIRAYIDANSNGALDPYEPSGVYAPHGQGAEAVFALSSAAISGIDLAISDPGAGASGVSGDGLAAIAPSTAPAGASVFTATITYTAGAGGIALGGRIGFTVPQGFPAPQFVTVASTAAGTTISAPTFSGLSAVSTVTAGSVLAGQQVVFVYDLASVPCVAATLTFSVSAAQNGMTPLAALYAGSPAVQVLPGAAATLQPANPYISLTQGALSDAQSLEAHDVCGNKTPVTSPVTATLTAERFDVSQSTFVVDSTVGLSSGAALSTASVLGVSFAVGQSSAPYYALSSSTGTKNLAVFYSLNGPATFYYGMTALPTGALSGAAVSTVSYAAGASSAAITPNGDGNADLAYISFKMADPTQPWHVLIASAPIKTGVAPSTVWESWGQGLPGLGRIAWDGRYSPWLNGGARVPSGIYYVRIELGGGGVHDDSLLIDVSVPQLAGRFYDAGVVPNPPLSGVNVQVNGPNGALTAQTDSLGNYVLPGVVAGAYNMYFNRQDYLSGSLSVTVNAAGAVSAYTPLSNSSASADSAGDLDVLMTRSSVLVVAISSSVSFSTQAADLWGGLQVQSSTSSAVPVTLNSPLHVAAGTSTFDDGGQWDPSVSTFVAHTQFRFNVSAGTYSVTASLPGVSPSTASVYVGPGVVTLILPPLATKSSISGLVSLPPGANPSGMFVSVNAAPLSSSTLVSGGFGGVFLAQNVLTGTYTVANLDSGTYLLRANAPGYPSISTGPISVPASSDVAHVDFPAFSAGAAISGTVTILDNTNGAQHLTVSAWAPGSLNFGSTNVVVAAGSNPVAVSYSIPGLSAGTTYQVFANLDQINGANYYVAQPSGQIGLPILAPAPQAALDFSFVPSSGVISGTILLPANATDFLDVSMTGVTAASAKPDDVGRSFSVASSTQLPNFQCAADGSTPLSGLCPVGNSSATFTVQGQNTETLSITFYDSATGQTVKKQLSVVNGSTTPVVIDLSPATHSISGAIDNEVTNALFNTNPNIVANAPFVAPLGYPAGISSTTARVEAILIPDITQYNTAISSSFNPATTRVGYLTAAGTYTVTNLPSGSYVVRTVDLRACSTCSVLVPGVSQTVAVGAVDVSSVNFTLGDGFTVSGAISLDGGIQDAQTLLVAVYDQRQQVVRSTTVSLGDPNLGLLANSVNYSFANLPANGFYTLTVSGLPAPSKYAGRPIQFPNPALSPNGLQSNLSGQNVLLMRSAMIVGRLQDANTGSLIGAAQAGLLAPNFQISATANPWTNGGYVVAASSVSNRPIQGDGYFRVGPLIPNQTYDLSLSQTNWDAAFLLLGSQNYSPVKLSGISVQPGEIHDVGVVSLNQGQSLTGTVRQSTTTGALLGGIEIDAVPSFNANGVTVQTFTNPQGKYTLWVSTYLSNTFNLTAAPRGGGNVSSGTVYGQVTVNSVNLLATTTADFLLNPLVSAVTSQVVVEDAASGGRLGYPFGANKGFPAAAVNLQPQGVVPTADPLGDIEAITDSLGNFSVPGLSTGAYAFKATSLGYSVFNATVAVSTTGFHIYTTSDTPSNYVPNNVVTLRRGATLTGSIVKSDGSAPNSSEVGGIAAANFAAGEYLIGSVNIDPTAKTVNSYTISGFKTGVPYTLVILPADKTSDSIYPPEGANVTFAAVESTTTKNLSLTYLPSPLDCVATSKGLGSSGQFQIKIDCTKALRNSVSSDNDLSALLTVSTFNSLGAPYASPNGTGQFLGSDKSLSQDRREFTSIYRSVANETNFSLRVRAYAASVDPKTGANFYLDKIFDFYTGLDSNVNQKISNINGGSVALQPSGDDETLGLDERSRIDLPPGVFAAGLDSDPAGSAFASATTTVSVGLSKAKDRQSASVLYMRSLGYVPSSVGVLGNASAFPAETWAAMSAFRGQSASTSTVGGANPLSSFYTIFLPAGIRHQLLQPADITFSYNTALSTSTDPNNINVYYYNVTLGKYVLENTNRRLDTQAKTITVAVNHFSVFVVLDGAPAITAPGTIATSEILAFNFPNPSDCVVHNNVTRDTRVGFGAGTTFAPFNGTMIRYSLPPGGPNTTTIRIYSLSGQLVRTIDQGSVAGNTTQYFPWACDNQSGKTVASGVYIGEVQWGGKHKYFKIAIVKGSGL